MAQPNLDHVLEKLRWMREERIWPEGLRYLWTDAFGLVLYVTLYHKMGDQHWLDKARWLVDDVERVLGRSRGIRIGEEPDREGQYFHYLAMWLFALARLGEIDPDYRERGIELVRQIHKPFVIPGTGVIWKMQEDLSAPYPGYGLGALDPFDGYVSYRLLGEEALTNEIADMKDLIDATYRNLDISQDLGLGMMLWLSHFFPEEPWAQFQRRRCLNTLDGMWQEDEPDTGFFCRQPNLPGVKFAFTNYGISVGLQAVGVLPERVEALNRFFSDYRSNDEYDRNAITHVMECSSHYPGLLLRDWEPALS